MKFDRELGFLQETREPSVLPCPSFLQQLKAQTGVFGTE